MQYMIAVINDKIQYLAGCLKISVLYCTSCALITVGDVLLQHQYSITLITSFNALQCSCLPLQFVIIPVIIMTLDH